MSYKIPYNNLPNLGVLLSDDIVPGLRPPFSEGSMTVADLTNFVNPSLQYRALMSQNSTSDPTIDIIFENRIGIIVWTYVSVGVYNGQLAGAFIGYVPEQTKVFFNPSYSASINYYTVYKYDDDNIRIETKDKTWALTDDLLYANFIDFFIYPALP